MKGGVVLAAGEGRRLRSSLPKYLQRVCGWPLLTHAIFNLREAGIEKIYVVLGYKAEGAQPYLNGCEVILQDKQKGTADAFARAVDVIPKNIKDILLIYVDTPLIRPSTLRNLLRQHKGEKADLSILTLEVRNPKGYGRVIRDERGDIICIKEEDLLRGSEKEVKEINVGAYVFKNTEFLKVALRKIKPKGRKSEMYLTEIISIYREQGLKVQGLKLRDEEEGMGINTREELIRANRIMYRRNAESLIKKGVTIYSPEHTYIERDVKIGRDTEIYPFVYIESGVRIGKRCKIGPNTRIREGSVIGDDVSIGNFVEIVRSRIGSGTKIKHFSYIGDTEIGRGVNIGAGTVTANFDGEKKNKTIIGDGAFIGSGTILVAPVKVGKEAVTGAGCVVPKNRDVPSRTIVVGVPAKVLRRR